MLQRIVDDISTCAEGIFFFCSISAPNGQAISPVVIAVSSQFAWSLVLEIQIGHTGSPLFSVIIDSHISPVSWPLWRSSWSNHISHWQALGWTCLPILNMIFYLLLYLQKQFFLAGHIKYWKTSKENWIQQTMGRTFTFHFANPQNHGFRTLGFQRRQETLLCLNHQ